jgi:TetR/AcrR family fatty acid metabolism transcriptional regulator
MPKIVDKDKRRREIAAAVLERISEEGFSISVDRMAEAAGVGKGTLYLYFDSREEIIFTALSDWTEAVFDRALNATGGTEPFAVRFRRLCHSAVAVFLNDPQSMKIVMGLLQWMVEEEMTERKQRLLDDYHQRFRALTADVLCAELKEKPGFNAKRITALGLNLMAFLDGICIYHWLSPTFDLTAQIDLFVNMFLAGLKEMEAADAKP